ncbi:MAG TPA: MBL fold metallo-hydrolase [Dehalococcoidia bacterium]|nr:MBL fold metallo-hydrolase [Dehalococcoidia bacterium]
MSAVSCRVGALTVLSLRDGAVAATPAQFFPAVSPAAWTADETAYLRADGRFAMNLGCFLVHEGESWTLVDTGNGTRPGSYGGKLLNELQAEGVAPEQIACVIITHLHADHAGGNTVDRDGAAVPLFPNARHVVQRRDWEARAEHARDFPDLDRCLDPIAEAGLLELIDGDAAVTAAISVLLTPGHTPGHQCVLLASGDEKAMIIGDLAHTPVQLNHPDWPLAAELEPAQAARSRAAVFDRVEGEGLLLCAGHFPHPSMGNVIRVAGRRRWQSL